MTKETFNKLVDDIINTASTTLKTKNAKYAPDDDALHNFHAGAEIMGTTTAQCIWGYATKHIVALRDKILKDDWSDLDDAKEKIQDIINYLIFIWCAANEKQDINEDIGNTETEEYCKDCEHHCPIDNRSCECCDYYELDEFTEPCKSCKSNKVSTSAEYKTAPYNWRHTNDKCYLCGKKNPCNIENRGCDCCKYQYDGGYDENLEKCTKEPCKSCKCNFVEGTEEYNNAPLNWEYME